MVVAPFANKKSIGLAQEVLQFVKEYAQMENFEEQNNVMIITLTQTMDVQIVLKTTDLHVLLQSLQFVALYAEMEKLKAARHVTMEEQSLGMAAVLPVN